MPAERRSARSKTTSSPERSRETLTVASLLREAERVKAILEKCSENEDPTLDGGLLSEYHVARRALVKKFEPLVRALVDARCVTMLYEPDGQIAQGGGGRFFSAYVDGVVPVGDRSQVVLSASSFMEASVPPPFIGDVDEPDIDDPSVFLLIPVTGQAIFQELWEHDGVKTRVLHTRPILADSSHVEFVDAEMQLLKIQPAMTETSYAVFGSVSEDIDLRYETHDVEVLLASQRVIFLGFKHEGVEVDWAARLETARMVEIDREGEEAGVILRGEYRELPRLDLSDLRLKKSQDDEDGADDEADV